MKEAAKRLAKRAQDALVAATIGNQAHLIQEELTDQEEQQVQEINSQINQVYKLGNYGAINELISNNGNIYKKAAFDQLRSYTAGLMKIDGEKILALNDVDKFHQFLQKNPYLGDNISEDQGIGIASQALSFAIKNYQDHPEILHNVIELIKEQNPNNIEILNQLSSRLVRTIQSFESVESAMSLDQEIKNLGANTGEYSLGAMPNKLLIKSQIAQACEQNKFANVNSIIAEAKKSCSLADFTECKSYAERLIKEKGEAILAKEKIADFKASDIFTAEEKNNAAVLLGTDFIDVAEKLLSKQKGYTPYEYIPTTTVALEEIYKDAKAKFPDNKELNDAYIATKKGLTKLETLDPNAALTKADLVVLGQTSINLKFYKAKEFAEFLQKKPLLGTDLSDDTADIGSQALNFAIENFRSNPQKFSSQPEMLHQVIGLVKEQNRNNPAVLTQLAQELVKVGNNANWPLSILDLDLEIKKLEKLGAKVENYHFGSLPEIDRQHFLNVAHIICKADSDPNITDDMANIINLSSENIPTEAEMISVHRSIQALKTKIDQIPASTFLIGSLKEVTEAYIKTQIHDHGDFRKAINVMEIAQVSPSHVHADDKKEGINQLKDLTIDQMTIVGDRILQNSPEHFIDFLQRGPLFSSNLDNAFTERTLQFGIFMAIDQSAILDKTLELFKEQYKDNDEVLENLTNKLIEYSNLLSEEPARQQALNAKIIEHLGEFLSIDHIDINKIIAQAANNRNSSLVSALILNNSSANIKTNLTALKLMHDTDDLAAEKLLQRPEEATDYLKASDSLGNNLFNLIISKIPSKLTKDEIVTLLECSNSIKSSERRNEINQRIEKDLRNFIIAANDNDFFKSIQDATYYNNPQLLNSIILNSNGRKIVNTPFEVIKSLQLLYRTDHLDAVAEMLENPAQSLLLIKESMDSLTKQYNPVSDELLEIIVTQLITNPKFNASMADQLVESIDKADPAQKRVIYETIQKKSAEFLIAAENTQALINKTLKDKEVGLLSEIINHVSFTDVKIDLEGLKLLHNKGHTAAVEKLLQHPDRATTYLNNAIDKDIDPELFKQIIKGITQKIAQDVDYEMREVDSPTIALVNCSNKAKNPAQRKTINAEIEALIPRNENHSSEDEDLVNEATTAKNGELLSILIAKNIIWSAGINLKTLEVLYDGKHTAAIDKLLQDPELAAGLLFEVAKAKEINQKLVDMLIPRIIKDKELGKPLLDALLPRITNAEQLNQIIDSQNNKDTALKAVANNDVSIALLSPENIIALTSLIVHQGIDAKKDKDFSQILTRMLDLTYADKDLIPGTKPSKLITESGLRTKLSESLFPKEKDRAAALCANPEFIQAVKSYYKERKNQEQKPIWTALKHWANNIKRPSFRQRDLQQYKFEKIVDKVEKIQAALTVVCLPALELQPEHRLSSTAQQAVKKAVIPIELEITEVENIVKPKSPKTSKLTEVDELSAKQQNLAKQAATLIIDAEREPASKMLTHNTSKKQIKPVMEH